MAKDVNRIRAIINDVVAVSVVALCGTVIWSTIVNATTRCDVPSGLSAAAVAPASAPRPPLALPEAPVALDNAYTVGSAAAPVVIIEYSDYQCPFCARFARETLPELKAAYVESGRVQFAFKHLPLDAIHPDASRAAAASECAGVQSQFWAMHDLLFENQKGLDEASVAAYSNTLGLDQARFVACLDDDSVRSKIRRHADDAQRLGLSGTPAFLIGVRQPDGRVRVTEVISGARPLGSFQAAIDRALDGAR